jgi:hypothetical protein
MTWIKVHDTAVLCLETGAVLAYWSGVIEHRLPNTSRDPDRPATSGSYTITATQEEWARLLHRLGAD